MTPKDPVVILAKALADENRYRLFRYIAEREEVGCAELIERVPLSQPTISHHMKILVEAELVFVRREGQRAFFSFNRERFSSCVERCAEIAESRKEPARMQRKR